MTDKEFIFFVRNLIKGKKCKAATKVLTDNGFEYLDEGLYKIAFLSKIRKDLVVKLYRGNRDWQEDSTKPLPKKMRKYWLKPLFHDKQLLIQYKVDRRRGGTAARFFEDKFPNSYQYDIHERNCGYYKGKPYIFDYCTWFS